MLFDLIVDGIVFIVNCNSYKGLDEDYQYGYVCYENVVLLGLGLLLIGVGVGMIWVVVESLCLLQGLMFVYGLVLVVVLIVLVVKEGLFCYMLVVVKCINLCMLIVNVWYVCFDVVLLLVVVVGVVGNLMGYYWLDLIVVCIVGLMIGCVGVCFGWEVFNDLMDCVLLFVQVEVIWISLEVMLGVINVYDLCMCVIGDQVLVDVYIEVDLCVLVSEGYVIVVWACINVFSVYMVMVVFDVQIYVDLCEYIVIDFVLLFDCDVLYVVLV